MKKILSLVIIILFAISVHAQTSDAKMQDKKMSSKEMKSKDAMPLKDHVCTSACMDGKHAYAHGEKGHTCTAEC